MKMRFAIGKIFSVPKKEIKKDEKELKLLDGKSDRIDYQKKKR